MSRSYASALVLSAALALAACGADDEDAGRVADTDPAAVAAPEMAEMHADTLGPRMEESVSRMDAAAPAEVGAMLPAHRDLVLAMIEECRQMMANMNMTPPAEWTQLETQLQQDLQQMAGGAPPAEEAVDQHLARVRAMMEMRDDMM